MEDMCLTSMDTSQSTYDLLRDLDACR
jgi:hypothetical protein